MVSSAYSANQCSFLSVQQEAESDGHRCCMHSKFPYSVGWVEDGLSWVPLYAHVDLPLNGRWEDQLTLKFEFLEHLDGYAMAVEGVEVM